MASGPPEKIVKKNASLGSFNGLSPVNYSYAISVCVGTERM